MKVGRGKQPPVPVTTVKTQPSSPLRVGIPGKTYTPPTEIIPTKPVVSHVALRMKLAVQEAKDLRAIGFERVAGHVRCMYKCEGLVRPKVRGLAAHSYKCLFWEREGKDLTPFD